MSTLHSASRRGRTSFFLATTSIAALVGAVTAAQAGSPVAVPANMLPQGGHFVAGSGTIGTQGLTETITQTSQRGIIDFDSFSIGKSGTVKINNGVGATLDRVMGGNLSQIMGTLSATGSVYLVNPQGVVVGKSGVVTTGGSFVASSLDISNQNFMAGQTLRFEGKGASDGVVKNLGSISSSGGDVFLIARSVTNAGSINAPNGTVGLGAGQEVLLKDTSVSGGHMSVRYGTGNVRNKGAITAAQAELRAAGGNVYALAGNHSGMIRATGSAMRGGHVWLTAGGSIFASGPIMARNHDGSGGRLTIRATKLVKVTGRIDVSASPSARSRESGNPGHSKNSIPAFAGMSGVGAGGTVIITAHDVTLGAHAVIDASGTGAGGTVLIGGDRQGGANASQDFATHKIANAQTTTVEAGAQILADGGVGGGAGSGGNVVVWSDQHTQFAGTISVTGGQQGGDGGFVETSSHGVLDFTGTADRLAPKGKAGTLLLDPEDLDISTGATANVSITNITTNPTVSTSGTGGVSTLNALSLENLLKTGNVTVQTSGTAAGTGTGSIDVQASIIWSNANSLTLNAFNGITIESGSTITNTGGGNLTLIAGAGGIGIGATISLSAVAGAAGNLALTTSGGGNVSQTAGTIAASTLTLSGSGGNFTLNGVNTVGTLAANIGVTGKLNFTNSGGYTLNSIVAESATLTEVASQATVSQANGATINLGSGTLTLNGASTNDTTYTLTGNNTVGILNASLGDMGKGSALTYTDASGNNALGNIRADSVTLNETTSIASIIQIGVLNVSGTLTLNGDSTSGDTRYNLSNGGSTVGMLVANLGTSTGGVGTGALTYVDSSLNATPGYTLGNITAGTVTLTEMATNATVSQGSGAVVKATSLSLNGTNVSFTLSNSGNSVGTLMASLGTGNLIYTDGGSGGFNIAGGIKAGAVTLTAGGPVTQGAMASDAISATSLSLNGTNVSYTLANSGNSVGTLSASLGTGALGFTDTTGFNIAGGIRAGSVTLTAGGAVTQGTTAADAISASSLSLNGANANYTLSNSGNTVGTLSASLGSGNLFYTDVGGFNIAGGITAGSVTLTAGGAVTQGTAATDAISATSLSLVSSGTSFALNNIGNAVSSNFNATLGTGNLSFTDGTGFTIAGGSSSGIQAGTATLSLSAGGTVTQGTNTTDAISVSNLVLLGANGNYTLANAGNIVGGLAANTGSLAVTAPAVTVASITDPLTSTVTNGITTTGATSLFSDSSITVNAPVSASSVQLANATLGTAITLGGLGMSGLSITGISGNITTNHLIIGRDDANASGEITIASNLSLPSTSTLTFESGVGATEAGATPSTITVGTLDLEGLSAAATSFTLNGANSVGTLMAGLGAGGGTLNFTNGGGFNIAGGITACSVTLTAGGPVTQGTTAADAISATSLSLNGTNVSYTLANSKNTIGTLSASLGTGNLSYTDGGSGGFNIAGGITAGSVTLTAGGPVTQGGNSTDAISATSLSLKGTNVSFTLDNSGNTVTTLSASLGTGSLDFTDGGGFNIAGGITANSVTLTAGGPVTQGGNTTDAISAAGLTLKGTNVDFTLTNSNNAVSNFGASLGSGNLSFTNNNSNDLFNINGITAGSVTLTSSDSVVQVAGITATNLTLDGGTGIYQLTDTGNMVGTLTGNTASITFTDAAANGLTLGAITTAGGITLNEIASNATVSQTGALTVGGTLTLNGSSMGDTSYNFSGPANSVGTLVANLGPSTGGVGTGTLTYVDNSLNATPGYTLGNITAQNVTLTEMAANATVTQGSGTGVQATSLTLNGNAAGNVSYTIVATGNSAANLTANLGTSAGGIGTGSLTYTDQSTGNGYQLGSIKAGSVTLTENTSVATISQMSGAVINTGRLTLNGDTNSNDTQYVLTNGNSVGTLVASLGQGNGSGLSYTDASGTYTLGAITADAVTLNETHANASISQSGAVNVSGMLTLNGDSTSGNTSYNLSNAGNTVGTLVASLGTSAGTGSLTYVDNSSGGFTLGSITAGTVALTEQGGSLVSQATSTTVGTTSLSLNGAGASYSLTNAGNNVGTLTGSTGSITLTDAASGGLTLGTTATGITGSGAIEVTNTGAITLANAVSSGASGDAIVLSSGVTTGTAFTVGTNGSLSATNGRFLVFTDKVGDVMGSTLGANPLYNRAFGNFTPGSLNSFTGSRFVYAAGSDGKAVVLTVTPTGANTTTVTYDGATQTATSNASGFAFTGFLGNDMANPLSESGTAGVTGGSGRNVGTYAFTATLGTLASQLGYDFQFGSGGGLVIEKANLTVTAASDTKTYDGTTSSGGMAQVTGLVGGDTASGFTQTFGSKNVQGQNGSMLLVNQGSGVVNDGNGGGNYAITFVNTTGTINKAALTVTEIAGSKVFDGTTGSNASAQVSGLKGSDTASGLTESFASANAGSQAMTVGGLTVNDGNNGGNYAVTFVNATGTITPALLTITANNATQVLGTPEPQFSASFGAFPAGLGPSALSGMLSFTTNAPAGTPGSFQVTPGGLSSPNFDITFVPGMLFVTPATNSLPPVPFEMDQGSGKPGFAFTDPVFASLLVEFAEGGGSQGANGGSASIGDLKTPTLDEIGQPLGKLIGFNSSFIEVCRTRASLCR